MQHLNKKMSLQGPKNRMLWFLVGTHIFLHLAAFVAVMYLIMKTDINTANAAPPFPPDAA